MSRRRTVVLLLALVLVPMLVTVVVLGAQRVQPPGPTAPLGEERTPTEAESKVAQLPSYGTATTGPLPAIQRLAALLIDGQREGAVDSPSVSGDGRWIAFTSTASRAVTETNSLGHVFVYLYSVRDVYVYDRQTGKTELVSVADSGSQTNGESFAPVISADGRWVAFWSFASNLVEGDQEECKQADQTYNCADVFLYDRQTHMTERIRAAEERGEGASPKLAISGDGRWVAFYSYANDLVAGDQNPGADVFIYGRMTKKTEIVSLAGDGTQGNGESSAPSMSADGRWLAFVSYASNLVSGDSNGQPDVFVRDRNTGKTSLVSVSSDGRQANGQSSSPAISGDGRWVAFVSRADNLVAGDTNRCPGYDESGKYSMTAQCADVFLHDTETIKTVLVSKASNGGPADKGSGVPTISADGRRISFWSLATNLVAAGPGICSPYRDTCPHVYVYDRVTGRTLRVSETAEGIPANGASGSPAISNDGYWIVFTSEADNLVPGDTNKAEDVFIAPVRSLP